MEFGVVLQTTPPSARVVDLAKRAETYGFDARLDVRQPHPVAGAVRHLQPDPGRDAQRRSSGRWSPTRPRATGRSRPASTPRSTRCTATARCAASAAATRRCASPTARRPRWPRCATASTSSASSPTGAASTYKGSELRLPWAAKSELEVWVAAYGPKALALTGEVGDGFILQLADLSIAEWTIGAVRDAADGRRPRPRRASRSASPPRPTSPTARAEGLAHGREQCRWFGGMVGNHVADIVARYGDDDVARARRRSPTTSRAAQGYDYNEHGQAGNTHTTFVPDEIVDRFCIVGPPEVHIERMRAAEGARRRPVRDLPPARRQGPHPAGLRREGHAGGRRARARRSREPTDAQSSTHDGIADDRRGCCGRRCSRSRSSLVVGRVGGLQGDRPGRRRRVLGWTCCRAPATGRCRTSWDMFSRLAEPEVRGGDADSVLEVVAAATWYSFRVALAGVRCSARCSASASPWSMARFQRRRARRSCRTSSLADGAAHRARAR